MKLEKLNVNNLGGGDLVQQIEAALIQIRDNINKYGVDAEHALETKVVFSINSDGGYWQNKVQTKVSCKLSETMHGANAPIKVDAKGMYDANNQLELPVE